MRSLKTLHHHLLPTAVLYFIFEHTAAHAADNRQYHIPAGAMDEVLLSISRESGRAIIFDPALSASSSPSIDGYYNAQQAVERAIIGADLKLEVSPNGAFIVMPLQLPDQDKASIQLAPMTVFGNKVSNEGGSRFGDVGFQSTSVGSSARLDGENAREIPITVNAMTNEVIRSRVITDISEAVRNMPGVSQASSDPSGPSYTIRGFKSSAVYVNGLGGGGLSDGQTPMEDVERVEVLKGPTSILTGASADGGAINIATKQPTTRVVRELTLGYGSHQQKSAALDLGGPIGELDNFTYRINLASSEANENYAGYKKPYHYLFSPSIKWDNGETSIITGVRYYQQKRLPLQNTFIPRTLIDNETPILHLSRSKPQVNRDLYYKNETFSPYINFSHDFGKLGGVLDVSFDNNLQLQQARDEASNFSWLTSRSAKSPDLFKVQQNRTKNETQRWINQTGITAKIEGSHFSSTTKVGVDYKKLDNRVSSASQRAPYPEINPFTASPRLSAFDGDSAPLVTTDTDTTSRGTYVVQKLDLWNKVHLFGQLRRDKVDTHLSTTRQMAQDYLMEGDSWVLGAAVDLTDSITVYASKSDGYVPIPSISAGTGKISPPEKRLQKEAGLRLSLLDEALTVTGSYYELQATNVSICDPVLGCDFTTIVPGQLSKGYELEVQGAPVRGLNVTASMGKVDARYQSADNTYPLAALPRYTASAWAAYTSQNERLGNATVGMGVTANSSSKTNSIYTTTQYEVPGYVTLDGLLAYDIDRWSLQLKLNNLLDKYYYLPSYGSSAISIGEGRNFVLQARYAFE